MFSMYMLREGFAGAYLGDYAASDVRRFVASVERTYPIDLFLDEDISEPELRLAANPAKGDFSGFSKKDVRAALNAPEKSMRLMPLPRKISIGPFKGDRFKQYTVAQAATISLEVAAANLAVFFPSTQKLMPLFLLDRLLENREITESDIEEFERLKKDDPRKKGAHPTTLANILISEKILGTNTKTVKTKIPASLGIGDETDDATLREAPVSGSVGLSFLPNFMILKDSKDTGQGGLLPILKALKSNPKYKGRSPEARRRAAGIDLSIEVLSDIPKNANGCPFASAGCRMVCLADSGSRYRHSGDYFGVKTEKLDERHSRLSLGLRQTAFLANPIAFLRLLIGACLQHAISQKAAVYEYILREEATSREPVDFTLETYMERIPPSVRLNVFADYLWESIYPDLFGLFDGKTRFPGQGVYPRVQFYDYTKIPGRWSTADRNVAKEYAYGELAPADDYSLPENYHITFSFNGTPQSKKYSDICSSAGQNATFVFFTQELGAGIVNNLFPEEGPKVQSFLASLRSFFKKASGGGRGTFLSKATKGSLLPVSYEGIRVIDGDNYDLRFLDASYPDDRLIVGLNWKNPNGSRIQIEGLEDASTVDPFRVSGGSTVSWTGSVEGRDVELAASFGLVRYGLSTEFPEGVRIYFIRKGSPSAESVRDTMKSLAELGDLDPNVTFATETGRAINALDDYEFQRQDVLQILGELGIVMDEELSPEDFDS